MNSYNQPFVVLSLMKTKRKQKGKKEKTERERKVGKKILRLVISVRIPGYISSPARRRLNLSLCGPEQTE